MSEWENRTLESIKFELKIANDKIPEEYKDKYKIVFEYDEYWKKPMFMVRKYKKFLFLKISSIIKRHTGPISAFNANYHLLYTIKEDIEKERILKISKLLR